MFSCLHPLSSFMILRRLLTVWFPFYVLGKYARHLHISRDGYIWIDVYVSQSAFWGCQYLWRVFTHTTRLSPSFPIFSTPLFLCQILVFSALSHTCAGLFKRSNGILFSTLTLMFCWHICVWDAHYLSSWILKHFPLLQNMSFPFPLPTPFPLSSTTTWCFNAGFRNGNEMHGGTVSKSSRLNISLNGPANVCRFFYSN